MQFQTISIFSARMSCKIFIPTVWAIGLQFVQIGKLMFVCVYLLLLHNWQRHFIIFSHPVSFQKGEISLNEASFLKARFLTPYSPIKSLNYMSNLNEHKRILLCKLPLLFTVLKNLRFSSWSSAWCQQNCCSVCCDGVVDLAQVHWIIFIWRKRAPTSIFNCN